MSAITRHRFDRVGNVVRDTRRFSPVDDYTSPKFPKPVNHADLYMPRHSSPARKRRNLLRVGRHK